MQNHFLPDADLEERLAATGKTDLLADLKKIQSLAKLSFVEQKLLNGLGGALLLAEEFSAGAWLRAAAKWAKDVPESTPMIIVGGTGLYFSALLRGLDRAWVKPPPEYPVLKIDRQLVRQRIADRLDAMFMAGLDEEKACLRELYPVWS